ncbi:MAG: ATP-binding cassette domain-containing protein [Bacteroidota bacterium]
MKIRFNQVMPIPLASIQHSSESIWGNEVSFNTGQKILLNASSGKGKSTFTSSAVGLRNDYTGTISYDELDIKSFNEDDWTKIRREKIAVVFQDLQLFPTLSVKENLLIKSLLQPKYSEVELKNFLEFLGIADKWEQKCGLLSMGQQQRVAIIRALIQPFQWLIMDEPFSHLDVENTKKCLELIHQRCDEQKAGFILTTLGETHGTHFDSELKL